MVKILIVALALLCLPDFSHADTVRVCRGPYSFSTTGTFPETGGVDVSGFDGAMWVSVYLSSGTLAADLQGLDIEAYTTIGSYTSTGRLKFRGPEDKLLLNVGTCTACVGKYKICGRVSN